MKLFAQLKKFRDEDSGAVTVDWVVLTAAIVGLGIAVLATVTQSVNTIGQDIGAEIGGDIDANSSDVTDSQNTASEG